MTDTTLLDLLSDNKEFATRHNGSNAAQQKKMLETIGVQSIEQLIDQTVPAA
ncbi:MAG: glycine dehydrogenase, partial [Psychromonas sp.]